MPAFKSKYRLCELFDIPIYIDLSLIVLLVFFATGGGGILDGLLCACLLLVSITAHELGHALVARSFGYETRDITLSLLGGCASLIALPKKAGQEFLTAIAGPLVSFVLSFLGMGLIALLAVSGGFGDAVGFVLGSVLRSFGLPTALSGELYVSASAAAAVDLVLYFAVMNTMLGFFNLLPGFPLDGGRIFRSAMRPFLPRAKATYIAMVVGRVVAVGIGLTGLWRMLNGRGWGFVTLMIAWMIWKEGYREYLLSRVESDWDARDYGFRVSPPPYER